MPTIEGMTPYPGTPGDLITATGVDIGVCTQIILTYTVPGDGSGPGAGVTVIPMAVTVTRVDGSTVTFTMPDFGVDSPKALVAKALFTLDGQSQYTRTYAYETAPTSVTPPPAEPPPPTYGYDIPHGPMPYPIGRVPWVFFDPYDDNDETATYNPPINPNKMTSPFPQRALNNAVTTAIDGQVLIWEGQAKPMQWSFSGAIFNADHYDMLRSWVYDRRRRIVITDHFGRPITVVLQEFNVVPVLVRSKYWRHDYTITGLVVSVGVPTRVPA